MTNGFCRGMRLGLATVAIVAGVAVGTAHADSILDFGIIAPTGGSIGYAGGAAPLVGSGIEVDNVVGLPSGTTLACVGCVLSFTTGNLTSSTATSWEFGGGPGTSITLVGAVPGAGIAAPTVLLSGQFGSATITRIGETFRIAGAEFEDLKNSVLLAFFGLPVDADYLGNFNISFSATGNPPAGFASTALFSGDIVNTAVPEPGTLLLLGSGLTALGYLAHRHRRQPS